ncbi:MAG TPA: Hsp20/alpha crystallin family protein [Candidatus Stackebrandtia excrementipullorum]|nr:Hsp20/alpha crystallin family protein [Candidatus Stackebrandtia excrementipullorum]
MLVRYRQPWFLSSRVNSEFDRLMSETFGRDTGRINPAADIVTEGEDVVVTLELPGIKADEVDITLDGRRLTVAGEHSSTETAEGDRYLSRGLRRGRFSRSFSVPEGTTAEQIGAELKDGLLKLRVSGVIKPQPQPQKIAVTSTVDADAAIEAGDDR